MANPCETLQNFEALLSCRQNDTLNSCNEQQLDQRAQLLKC